MKQSQLLGAPLSWERAVARKRSSQTSNPKHAGSTVSEYGFLIALVAALAILGITNLGSSVDQLFKGGVQILSVDNTQGILKPQVPAEATNSATTTTTAPHLQLAGTGYYTVSTDPLTGQPVLKVVNGTQTTVNAASVEGNFNTLGTFMLARQLAEMAAEATNPQEASYLKSLASAAFYLGGAEGQLDAVEGVKIGSTNGYGNTDAIHDMLNFSQQLSSLMQNPPAGFDTQRLTAALPLAVDVFNIAQNYKNNLKDFIGSDGTVYRMFANTPADGIVRSLGNGSPGGALANVDYVIPLENTTDPNSKQAMAQQASYADKKSYDEMKTLAETVVQQYNVQDVPVAATMDNGLGLDQQAHNP